MKYVYPAVFYCANEGGYYVVFPDVAGALTQGETLYETIELAEDALAGILMDWEDFKAGKFTDANGNKLPMNNRIVDPTPIDKVVAEPDEFSTGAFVTLIKADTDAHRKMLAELEKAREAEAAKTAKSGAA